MVSLTVTISIALFVFYIETPEEEKKFEIVEAFKLSEIFDKEMGGTNLWYFSGGLGRHTRAVTIPVLAARARKINQQVELKLQVINPDDVELCKRYADYRRGLKSASDYQDKWTVSFVRREILATIICALLYKWKDPLLDVSICLKNNFSTLRIDLGSKSAIITKEDPKEPALICREESFLYRSYKSELQQTFKHFKQVNFDFQGSFKIAKLTGDEVSEILLNLGMKNGLTTSDSDAIAIIIKENHNPYV